MCAGCVLEYGEYQDDMTLIEDKGGQWRRVRDWVAAHSTLLLSFVAMYAGLGPHLGALDLDSSQTMVLRLVALPGMFAALLVGSLSKRLSLAVLARTGAVLGAVGLAGEALLASNLVGTAAASLVFVTGISMAVSSVISLFGEAWAPHRAGGMALNGFVLFLGASLGPLVAHSRPASRSCWPDWQLSS